MELANLLVSTRQFLRMVSHHALDAVTQQITFRLVINPKDKPLNLS
jgi:hypothetical protein